MISVTRQRPPLPRRLEIPLLIRPCSAQSAQKCEAFPVSADAATILHLLSGSGTCPSPEDLTCPIPFHRSFAEVPVTRESSHNRLCRSRACRTLGSLAERADRQVGSWTIPEAFCGPHIGFTLDLTLGVTPVWLQRLEEPGYPCSWSYHP